jgi:Protein of unknown function (DUF3800)
MKFDVYCDETRPDLFCSKNPPATYLVIGSLWAHREDRDRLKAEIHALRDKHKVGGEFKWQKISPSRLNFYCDLVSLFFAEGDRLRFRCIAVDHSKVDLVKYHESDQELGFYKFYYQVLHHWIHDFNEYSIFCDHKRNQNMRRLHVLQACLANTNISATISKVQAVRSHESVMIQLVDVFVGAASAKLNQSMQADSAKAKLVEFFESKLGRPIAATNKGEAKFNVFAIDPKGGW